MHQGLELQGCGEIDLRFETQDTRHETQDARAKNKESRCKNQESREAVGFGRWAFLTQKKT
jgi:hypothetical protein